MEPQTTGTAQEQCKIIKPTINRLIVGGYSLFAALPISLLGALFGGLNLDPMFGTKFIWLITGGMTFAVIFVISWSLQVSTLSKTEYRFYQDRIEYFEGFLVQERKTIPLDRIVNVGQRKGIVEGLFGLGTVYLETAGSSATGNELSLYFLENPDVEYDWLSRYISANRARR